MHMKRRLFVLTVVLLGAGAALLLASVCRCYFCDEILNEDTSHNIRTDIPGICNLGDIFTCIADYSAASVVGPDLSEKQRAALSLADVSSQVGTVYNQLSQT